MFSYQGTWKGCKLDYDISFCNFQTTFEGIKKKSGNRKKNVKKKKKIVLLVPIIRANVFAMLKPTMGA